MSTAIRQQKEQKVQEIKDMLSAAKSFVVLDYKGITVAQDTEMRVAFRKAGVKYHVLKNRLVKIALNDMGYTQFDEALNGPTAIAIATDDDIAAPARIAFEKATAYKKMDIKCAMVDGLFLDQEGAKKLATLPTKEVLVSQLLAMLLAPVSAFARVIDAIAKKQAE